MMEISTVSVGSPAFDDIRYIRRKVFVDEQGVDPANEFDTTDESAVHLLAYCENVPAGTARLYGVGNTARIGRVAVLDRFRRRGIGYAIMVRALEEARKLGYHDVMLHSQVQAVAFYESLGFMAEGDEFLEEGIRHRTMRCFLSGGS